MQQLTTIRRRLGALAAMLALFAMVAAAPARADDQAKARATGEELVTKAFYTVEKMRDHPEFGKYVRSYMRQAAAVVVFPEVLKAGFFLGGEGGNGVLVAKTDGGDWSYPAFFAVGAGTFGLQIGVQRSELMLIVMNRGALSSIIDSKVTIGGELSGAIGPRGAGAEAATTANLDADVIAYSLAEGAFIGVSVKGAVVFERPSLTAGYYGSEDAKARSVVIRGRYSNPQADELRAALGRYTGS